MTAAQNSRKEVEDQRRRADSESWVRRRYVRMEYSQTTAAKTTRTGEKLAKGRGHEGDVHTNDLPDDTRNHDVGTGIERLLVIVFGRRR